MSRYLVTGGAGHAGRTPRRPNPDDVVADARAFTPTRNTERQQAR
ncbi:hypothetical protein ACFVYP_31615 [Kitasatospora sp. NPDC058201]